MVVCGDWDDEGTVGHAQFRTDRQPERAWMDIFVPVAPKTVALTPECISFLW